MINQKAGEIYKLSKNPTDMGATVLRILSIVRDSSIDEILQKYNQILSGEVKIAEVITVKPLQAEQKKKLEKYVISAINETPIFLYTIDPNILGGFIVKIDDNVIDESIIKKILEFSIN